jgi:hypothetical protein
MGRLGSKRIDSAGRWEALATQAKDRGNITPKPTNQKSLNMHTHTKTLSLALAVAGALTSLSQAGHEIASSGKKEQVPLEQPKQISGSISAGYSSRYIFRGTNLMPSSNGMIYADAHVNYGGFTAGVWIGTQLGSASVPGALAIGEGGGGGIALGARDTAFGRVGGGGGNPIPSGLLAIDESRAQNRFFGQNRPILGDDIVDFIGANYGVSHDVVVNAFDSLGLHFPKRITLFKQGSEAFQDNFTEIDLYLQYSFSIGPVDVTFGNIFFYIDRDSSTRVDFREYFASRDARELVTFLTALDGTFGGFLPGNPRIGNPEDILVNKGRRVSRTFEGIEDEQYDRLFVSVSTSVIPYISPRITYYQTIYNEGEDAPAALNVARNDEKGGYLEFKVNGEIPIIRDRLNLDPYALVSYSAGDRSEPDGSPLRDWNHFQAGAELVFQVTNNFRIIPQINYMHHISDPPLGTERNEWWGGAKVEYVF